jgi:hypothetical protein
MKTKRMVLGIAAALVAAIVLSILATAVEAQSNRVTFRGKFTLPYEVRWGRSVLPAGDYSFTVSSGASLPDFITVSSKEKSAVILVGETTRCDSCSGELLVVRSRGQRAIRELQLPGSRSVFYHAKPDVPRDELGKQKGIERIRVAADSSN